MPFQLYHLLAFVISGAVVLVSTPIVRQIGLRSGRVDQPGGRKVHTQPMVRLGGISIFLGTLISLLFVWWSGGFIDASGTHLSPTDEYEIRGVTLGGFAFFLIGLLDDLFGLSASSRLLMQALIAGIAWHVGVSIDFLSIPFVGLVSLPIWISLPVTIIWLVGMTNAINWIDGLDGLAAGVCGIAALIMLVVSLFMAQPAAALIAAALAGGSLCFLRYNFNPAKIFMGDGGSYFIGFTLAGVGVIGLIKSVTTVAVLLPYLILAVPILDMSAVILDRIRCGSSPFVADKRHLHHRLLKAGLSHRWAVLFIYALTLWAGSLAIAFAGIPSGFVYAAGATGLLTYAGWRVKQLSR